MSSELYVTFPLVRIAQGIFNISSSVPSDGCNKLERGRTELLH